MTASPSEIKNKTSTCSLAACVALGCVTLLSAGQSASGGFDPPSAPIRGGIVVGNPADDYMGPSAPIRGGIVVGNPADDYMGPSAPIRGGIVVGNPADDYMGPSAPIRGGIVVGNPADDCMDSDTLFEIFELMGTSDPAADLDQNGEVNGADFTEAFWDLMRSGMPFLP